ncbi:MAG: tRNA epoxyqueuosine(34) reductase QueG [Bacteroidetes bacterium]|nr:tRNA epoxyqueuosine(34) reductase QueG [Bacteroidota bacterium]
MTAEERVKEKAGELGFSLAGIARAQALAEESHRLRQWLGRNYQASMRWMDARESERTDPDRVLPGVRSVVALAMNYYTPASHSTDPEVGKISRYAWGEDYHAVLGERLRKLSAWMEGEFPGSRSLWYVDTGPVMEKVWAERGGIGWIGKHTTLISRELGSWVFLGEILTTVDLEPDQPATDHCGTCVRCIEACPTGAIVEPYVLDSGKCLSYVTIEHRGDAPAMVAGKYEGWIFGCDICQDVCPWNLRRAVETEIAEFHPRPGHEAPNLREWLTMSREEFQRKFAGSPIRRAKWEGLLRNIRGVLRGT